MQSTVFNKYTNETGTQRSCAENTAVVRQGDKFASRPMFVKLG